MCHRSIETNARLSTLRIHEPQQTPCAFGRRRDRRPVRHVGARADRVGRLSWRPFSLQASAVVFLALVIEVNAHQINRVH